MERTVLIGAWLLAAAAYLTMLFWSLPTLSAYADGRMVFDMMPGGYSLAQASELVKALGSEGRGYYLGIQHWLDAAYPPLLGIALALSFRRLFSGNAARALIALAILATALDLMENAAVSTMLKTEPAALTASMVTLASRLTMAKSATVTLAFVMLLLGLAGAKWKHFFYKA